MDLNKLKEHVDARLDRIEEKLDSSITTQAEHRIQIQHLQGFAKTVITILLSCAGFLALAFFSNYAM